MNKWLKVVPAALSGIAVMSMSFTAAADFEKSKQSAYMLVHNKTDQPAVIVSYKKQKGWYAWSGAQNAYKKHVDYVKSPSNGQVLSPGGTDKWQVNSSINSYDFKESAPDIAYSIKYEVTWPDKSKSSCTMGVQKKKSTDASSWRTACTNDGKTKLKVITKPTGGNAVHYTLVKE